LGKRTGKDKRELSIMCNLSIKLNPPCQLGFKALIVGQGRVGVSEESREDPLFALNSRQ
jgi:hypothetical protein